MKFIKFFLILFFVNLFTISAQKSIKDSFFNKVSLKIDTFEFNSEQHSHFYQGEKYLFFKSLTNQDFCEITLVPHEDALVESVQIMGTSDLTIIDSLRHFDEKYYRGKIKFNDLENARNLSLIFSIKLTNGKFLNYQLKLYVFNETVVNYDNEPIEVFVDEEKTIELPATNIYNIKLDSDFSENQEDEIKISPGINNLKLRIKPRILGSRVLTLRLKTIKPFINSIGEISYELPSIKLKVNAKPNRVDYINPDKNTIYFNQDYKAYEDIQFDYSKNMSMRKTYRIEDQQESGGNLIAEIFTQSQVGNSNKVICRVRTFSLHRKSDGYLFIKDGDKTRFLTNFDIIEKPRIDAIEIMHAGEDWTNNLMVYPGEKIEVRIKGTGLLQSAFQFDGAENIIRDTARLSDEVAFYMLKVPANIPKRKVNIFMNKIVTQYAMIVKEYQQPTDFDFILVNYSGKNIPLSSETFSKPVFFEGNIKDINLFFDPSKIDEAGKLNGKQYVNVEVKIFNSRNDLLEVQNINNLVICPVEGSPRSAYYDLKDCRNQSINLNDYLVHKTYTLDPFTQIFITISHNVEKHGVGSRSKQVKLILKRKYNFDVQVSFPAGLLLYRFGDQRTDGNTALRNFSGISIAFIAQLQFYDGDNVNKFKPYSVGAGFIAIDAFNFSTTNTSRDLAVVVLGTLTPIQRGKLSFPLYLGGGYLTNQARWFVLFGPGLRFSF
jgi:hypothetical protein